MFERTIEFFSGSGNLSRTLSNHGFLPITIDSRFRKNTCEPFIQCDILDLDIDENIFSDCHLMWFGLPCTAWSNSSGNFHIDKDGVFKSQVAIDSLRLLEHVLAIIEHNKPKYWAIENPRGRLANQPVLIDFLKENNGLIHNFSMGAYGFPTQKPTQVFSNWKEFPCTDVLPYGRGAKADGSFDNLTKNQRQSYPLEFCEKVARSL